MGILGNHCNYFNLTWKKKIDSDLVQLLPEEDIITSRLIYICYKKDVTIGGELVPLGLFSIFFLFINLPKHFCSII